MFINIIIINYNTVRHCSIENDEIDKQIKRWEKSLDDVSPCLRPIPFKSKWRCSIQIVRGAGFICGLAGEHAGVIVHNLLK
jgi:hypothetical protein